MTKLQTLENKIKNRTATVGVVGLGYVGLPLAVEFCRSGFRTIGVDLSQEKISSLKNGQSYILDIKSDEFSSFVHNSTFLPTTQFSDLSQADCISVCVPTPLSKSQEPDLSYIQSAVESLKKVIHREGVLIVLESTTYPGTTRELVAEEFVRAGFTLADNIFIAFSPERVDPGNKTFTTKNTPKVIGGITPDCTNTAKILYASVLDQVIAVASCEEAEMVKLLENTFRGINIALVNELLLMCDRMNINIWNVIDAAATKPFGFMPFYPGPGIGGHCIPLDPTYLSWRAKAFDFHSRFIEVATDINRNMPRFVVQKVSRVLNESSKSMRGSKCLVIGVAYKKDVNDIRESPAIHVIEHLKEEGCIVDYHDPFVPTLALENTDESIHSIPLNVTTIEAADICIILTQHSTIDWDQLKNIAEVILDTRGVYKKTPQDNIRSL